MTNEQGQQILVAPQVFADAIQQLEAALTAANERADAAERAFQAWFDKVGTLETSLTAAEQERDFYQGQEMTAHKRADMLDAALTAAERDGDQVVRRLLLKIEDKNAELALLRPRAARADEFRKFDAFVLELGSSVYQFAGDWHRLQCPNKSAFDFQSCPYFSCKMRREKVEAVRTEWHEGPVARYDALPAAPVQTDDVGLLLDVIVWMSGSGDFEPDAVAGEAWRKYRDETVRPVMQRWAVANGQRPGLLALEPAAGSQP